MLYKYTMFDGKFDSMLIRHVGCRIQIDTRDGYHYDGRLANVVPSRWLIVEANGQHNIDYDELKHVILRIDKDYERNYIYCENGEIANIGDLIKVKNGTGYVGVLVRVSDDGLFMIRCDDGILHEFCTTEQNPVFVDLIEKKLDRFEYLDISQQKMSSETFQKLLDELDGNSLQTLKEKNARYSINGDALHNFRSGAEVAGGTPAQACWGYMTKHLVALRDMVQRDDFSNREDFLEKCQDAINYIRFLWCIGNEENQNRKGE